MPSSILMPALSPTMTAGKLSRWLKKEGDAVKAGDAIAEIETDKATMEVQAVEAGIIGKIMVAAGTDAVPVNDRIAVLLDDGEGDKELKAFLANDNPKTASAPVAQSSTPATASAPAAASLTATKATGGRIVASPLAKRLARDKNIDLNTVRGSGPHGRIVRADVLNFTPAANVSSAPRGSSIDARKQADLLGMAYDAIPNSAIRKVIATRLSESKQTVPHFYLTVDCRLDALLEARKTLNAIYEARKVKVSVNDFIIKACALALQSVPAANTAWTDSAILQFKDSDISVAVATPNGLITPIIKAAQNKALPDISLEMKDLAARAKDGKLKPTEFQGGTFSISNLGMFGVKDFAAIINPPQACILAVGAGVEQPVVNNGKIEIGTVMSVTLSVDHRCVDGAVGAEFLAVFKGLIENPIGMFA